MIDDKRTEEQLALPRDYTVGHYSYLNATDKFMSGWGNAKGKSYVSYDLTGLTDAQVTRLYGWMKQRGDYKLIKFAKMSQTPRAKDHLAIYTPPAHIIGDS